MLLTVCDRCLGIDTLRAMATTRQNVRSRVSDTKGMIALEIKEVDAAVLWAAVNSIKADSGNM